MPIQARVLLGIVAFGMTMNFVMFVITAKRKIKYKVTHDDGKDELARLTLNRAMRLEFIFFVCQLARFIHTFYEVHSPNGQIDYGTDTGAVIERGFVTLALVACSLFDFYDRSRVAAILNANNWDWLTERKRSC